MATLTQYNPSQVEYNVGAEREHSKVGGYIEWQVPTNSDSEIEVS